MKRNYGIDLLRLVLMFMVVVLHVLGHGGILMTAQPMTGQYITAWLMESLAYGAVNGYALITGCVRFGRRHRLAPVIQLWLQGLLYSLGIAICVWVLKPEYFSLEGLLYYGMPVSRGGWWYLSTYVCLSVIMPFLDLAVDALSEKQAKKMLVPAFVVLTILPTLAGGEPFGIENGYSVFWLACLYVLGACIRKFGWFEKVKPGKAFAVYLMAGVGCCAWVIVKNWLKTSVDFLHYMSPLVVIGSVALFVVFRQLRVSEGAAKWIRVFSPAAFGVYLIHEHELIKHHAIKGTFAFFARFSTPVMILLVLATAAVIFTGCLFLDLVRHKVFQWLKVKERLEALEDKCFSKVS